MIEKVSQPKLAHNAEWLGQGLINHVRELSQYLKPQLPSLERRFDLELRKQGFDTVRREALAKVSPLAAARTLLSRKALMVFFGQVEKAGRELAQLNVTPKDVTRALQICDRVINTVKIDPDYGWAREQLSFCTILALNHAYYEVREAESRAFYELFQIEVQASNVDVLFRRFLEAMA